MLWKITNKESFLKIIGSFILLAGLGSAIIIYLIADNDSDSIAGGYEAVNGDLYPALPSKKYEHDLAMIGGKSAVLANDFKIWFVGLWHGESLAVTIAFIAIITSGVIFFVANNLSVDDGNDDKHRGKYFKP
jgi:hypothetical protein